MSNNYNKKRKTRLFIGILNDDIINRFSTEDLE
jgi:hypothetical protein